MEGLIFVIFLMICAMVVFIVHKMVCKHDWELTDNVARCKKCGKVVSLTCQHKWEETRRSKITTTKQQGEECHTGYFVELKCSKCGDVISKTLTL